MTNTPTIDYLSKDYDGFKQAMLDYASSAMPQWQTRSEGDFGVTLVELMAYMGDILSYYGDRIQGEAYLPTATQRLSLLQIANLLGYIPSNGVPATGTVTFQTSNPGPAVLVPAGTQVSTDYNPTLDSSVVYETNTDVTVPANGGTATVAVTQGTTQSNVLLGVSDGTPSQRLRIPQPQVLDGTVEVFVANGTDASGNLTTSQWLPLDYLVDATGTDQVFSTSLDESGSTWVEFGDNVNGAIPGTGLNIYVTYRVGGGQVGNVSAGSVSGIVSAALQGVSIALDATGRPITSAMTGGADPETNDQIRANAPRVFRTQDRAVNLQDFSDLALSVPGVLRANAVAKTFTNVSLFIVGPSGGTPSSTLLNTVQSTVSAKALAGTSVTVSAPTFVSVNIGTASAPVVVQVYDRYKQSAVLAAVQQALTSLLAFSNVDFGVTLTVSDFYLAIMSVPGVQSVSLPMVARADAAQTGTADLVFRPWEIPVLGALNITANGGAS